MENSKPRVLVYAGQTAGVHPLAEALGQDYQVDVVERMDQARAALRDQEYQAVFADTGDFLPLEREMEEEKSNLILNTIGEGVCLVDREGRCRWFNQRMGEFSSEIFQHVRRICSQAMRIFTAHSTSAGGMPRSKKFTFQAENRYFEMICSPGLSRQGQLQQVVAVVWDATSGKRLQSKIDAIDSAGRELARIEGEAVTKLSPSDRLKLLQDKIIRYSRELMHFEHFAIRLLDKRTRKLEVVIAEGLPSEALEIDFYAQPEGNGISGYVASTGRSYICHDTEKDSRYVLGLEHCKSSLTVPLMLFDEVVGTYNVESTEVGVFNEDDRQFAEIFGRYVGLALNILDLLVVERYTTSGQITNNVVQEMAQPLNDIAVDAQTLKEQYIGDDALRDKLGRIAENVESIRHAIHDVAAGPKTVIGSEQAAPEEKDPLLKGQHVLVADDEPNIRTTISEVLSKHGCEVELAKDGFEAASRLEQDDAPPFNLIIADIKMPYRNGYEIYAAARRRQSDVPVMLMTGFGYDPHHCIVRAGHEGLSSILFKPFKVDQLLEEVSKALGGNGREEGEAANAFVEGGAERPSESRG